MNEGIKAEWQKKLRSGEFAQGSGQLRSWDEEKQQWVYCCLGILCEMSGLAEWEKGWEKEGYAKNRRMKLTYLGSKHYLPVEVAEWAGIDPRSDEETDVQRRLSTANDEGASFSVIADQIGTTWDL